MDRFSNIINDGQASLAVDVAIDDVCNPQQVEWYFETCNDKGIDKYSVKGLKLLLGNMTEEQMSLLKNLIG